MSTTGHMSQMMLDKETDARFWAQTGYKVNQKLDLSNPTDKAMAKVWMDIYAKVKAEDAAGKLTLTYNHPHVEQHLDNAEAAMGAATAHVAAATNARAAGDAQRAAEHLESAKQAGMIAATSTREAAKLQPANVSPEVAHAAAVEAAHNNAAPGSAPPAPPAIADRHPSRRPEGRPAHPGLATPHAPIPIHPGRGGRRPMHRHGDPPDMVIINASPSSVIPISEYGDIPDYVALAQATASPQVAMQVHEDAAAAPVVRSTISSADQAVIKAAALAQAQQAGGPLVGVILDVTGGMSAQAFPDENKMNTWYGDIAGRSPTPYRYIATFKNGQLENDAFGDSKALLVNVQPDPAPETITREVAVEKVREVTSPGKAAAVAIGITGVIAAIAAGRRHRRL